MSEPDNIETVLSEHELASLIPVSRAGHRMGCTVYDTRIATDFGDAVLQVQVYPLGTEPESLVDLEEEITALSDRQSSRKLVREIRDRQWGILVTCSAADWEIARKFFESGPEEERKLAYHPQLNRILGGDLFWQREGRWIKSCLAPVERAMEMMELLPRAKAAYDEGLQWPDKLEWPMPRILAAVELKEELTPRLSGAPKSYSRLAQIHFVIASPEVIQMRAPDGAAQRARFARQLFGFLSSMHRAGIRCSRDVGCCLRPEFLLADGSLTDVYFMWNPTHEEVLEDTKRRDLGNALAVTCELAGNHVGEISEMIATALRQYTDRSRLSREVKELIESAAADFANGNSTRLEALQNAAFHQPSTVSK